MTGFSRGLGLLVLIACGGVPPTRAEQVVTRTGVPENGRAIFREVCGACHGEDGAGTRRGPPLISPLNTKSPELIITIVVEGVPGTSMAAYERSFTDEQLADLYAYMRDLLVR